MSDSDPVYLSMGAARQTRDVVRFVQGMPKYQIGKNRRYPIPDDGSSSSSCTRVRFSILVADAASRSALCLILARPYGCAIADVPGTLFDGAVIEVCDPSGCFLNETDDALAGREGWAEYVLPINRASWCQAGDYYLVEEWEIFSLCCAVFSCDL